MSLHFDILETPLADLRVLRRKPIGDQRGHLERIYCSEALESLTQGRAISQINHTYTLASGTVRGMHFQRPPYAEVKFVNCLRGKVFDVAVDLRDGSPTFLRWYAVTLSADNYKTLVIPEGFAHGFQTLTDDCEMLYFHTAAFNPDAEGGLNARDPRLAIEWPLPVAGMSPRDAAHALVNDSFIGMAT